jgi:adenylate cyclase
MVGAHRSVVVLVRLFATGAVFLLNSDRAIAQDRGADAHAWADSLFRAFEAQEPIESGTGAALADSLARFADRSGKPCDAIRARMFQANFLSFTGQVDQGVGLLQASLDKAAKQCDPQLRARLFTALSNIYLEAGDLAQADSVVEQALRSDDAAAWTSEQRGGLRFNQGSARVYAGRLDEGMAAFTELYRIGKAEGDQLNTELGLLNMATVNAMQGHLQEARKLFSEVLLTARAHPLSDHLLRAYQNLAALSNDLGDQRAAMAYLDSAIAIARSSGDLQGEMDITLNRAETSASAGNFEAAYGYMRTFVQLRDSILGVERVRAVADVREKYETEKKAKENANLRAVNLEVELDRARVKRIRNILWLGLAFAITFGSVFFFQRNRISREKARSEELLLNILPEEVAEELKAKGEAEARLIDQVTVLFTDFKGFTALSEKLSPKELVRDIHECFSAFDHICQKHNIEKIKTIGDAYMAAGGLPVPNTTHASDVINAALAMRDFIAAGKRNKVEKGLPYFEIRIGVHTGPVVAGIVGVKKFQYDIWGDTVNIASRMESSGEVGQVNISEATYELVKDAVVEEPLSVVSSQLSGSPTPGRSPGQADNQQPTTRKAFIFTPRGKVQAKGKGELEMYFVR